MGRILLAVAAVPSARVVTQAATERAAPATDEVLVLSVREREFTRGLVWDRRPPGEVAEVVSEAIYQLQRMGITARGIIRLARAGKVAEEILYTAARHRVDQIVIGSSERSRLARLLFGSVSPAVVRLAQVPVMLVPTRTTREVSARPVSFPGPPRSPR